jgi:hypothetical protein
MSSLTGWVEAMVFFALSVGLIAIIFAGMNADYSESYSVGINTSSIETNLKTQTSEGQSQILGGEANNNANSDAGILSTSIGILTGSANMIWGFVTGGWIETIIGFLNLGIAGTKLAIYLRIFWTIGVVFALAYAIFKVRP